MTTKLQFKGVIEPDLAQVLQILKQDIFATLNCVMPGQIQSFDATKCTATVQPMIKRVLPSGDIVSRPLLVDVPVYFPGGGGGRLTFPVANGDFCLLCFSDRRIDEWMQTAAESAPADLRMHDVSDAIAIVGLDPQGAAGPVPTDKVVLSYQGSEFQITGTGWHFVGEGGAELDLDGATAALKAGGAEIDLAASIITLKNGTTSLLVLLDGLIDVIAAATVQTAGTPPLTAVTIAALQAYKIQLATLLA